MVFSLFPRKTDLTLPAEPPEQLVGLELALLVRHHPGHLEDEPRLRLLVQADGVEGQHPGQGGRGVVHGVHNLRKNWARSGITSLDSGCSGTGARSGASADRGLKGAALETAANGERGGESVIELP